MRGFPHRRGRSRWFRRGALVCLVALAGCNRESIVHDLTERDANRLVTELHGEGIDAVRKPQSDGRYALEVEQSRVVGALHFLQANRLVREVNAVKTGGGAFGATREDRRFHYERSISRELEETLERIPGIREARVHLNIPVAESIFDRGADVPAPTASVLVVASAKAEVDREALARLVAGAAGLGAPRVTVIVEKADAPLERKEIITAPHPQKPSALPALMQMGALKVSQRWVVVTCLLCLGVLLLGYGFRVPKAPIRVVTPRSVSGAPR